MKATFIYLESAIEKSLHIVTLLSLLVWVHPGIAQATSLHTQEVNSALVFNIEPKLNTEQHKTQAPQNSLNIEEIINADPLKIKLEKYLLEHDSPLAADAGYLIQLPNWKKDLAIATVESNLCIHSLANNCSGIMMKNGKIEPFANYRDWAKRMDGLMASPTYANRSFKAMIGIYVVPGSFNWHNGAERTYAELENLEKEAHQERVALANNLSVSTATQDIQLIADKK
jgi:hypothetical protein